MAIFYFPFSKANCSLDEVSWTVLIWLLLSLSLGSPASLTLMPLPPRATLPIPTWRGTCQRMP